MSVEGAQANYLIASQSMSTSHRKDGALLYVLLIDIALVVLDLTSRITFCTALYSKFNVAIFFWQFQQFIANPDFIIASRDFNFVGPYFRRHNNELKCFAQ